MKFYRLSGATFYDCSNTIYQFIKPFLDNKISIFEEYGAFKNYTILYMYVAQGQGQITPRGHNLDCNQKVLII